MKHVLFPFRVVFKIYFLIVFVSSLLVLYPVFYFFLKKKERFPKAFVLMKYYAFMLLLFAGTRLKIKGAENIPKKGAFIICPNHSSFLDIFCIYTIFNQYFVFIGKKEIEKWPLFNIFYTSGMNILVDRNNGTGSIKAFKRMLQEIDQGNPLVIFPEGTISKQAPVLAPFKSGAFAIAIQKQIPVVAVTFISNWKLLQRGKFWKGKAGPGIAEVIIHKPVFTKGLNKENVDQLQNEIHSLINIPLVS